MIISNTVMVKVNTKNIKSLKEHGYNNLKIKNEIEIKVEHLSKGSHYLIDVCCDVCQKQRSIMYKEYLYNLKSGGYYSCQGICSTGKNKKTCLEKYGVDNPTKSVEILEKRHLNNILKYGYEYNTLFNEKLKLSIMDKYGVDNLSKSEEVREKRKKTMIERYNVEYYVLSKEFKNKSEKSCIKNYGKSHPMKIKEEVKKRLNKMGLDFETNDFIIYRRLVDKFTKYNRNKLLENWNGNDAYDGEYIKENFNLKGQHGDYPTIDHIKSVKECFNEGLLPIYVADINNLCITKRRINSKKGFKNNIESLSK